MSFHKFKAFGLTGTWAWTLPTNEQVWSPNLWRLLGLCSKNVLPSYDHLYWLIHPDDRHLMPEPDRLAHVVGCPDQIFRLIRPDGGSRTMSSRVEICQAQDGRPTKIIGVLLDMVDHALLRNAEEAERERMRMRIELERSRALISTSATYAHVDFSDEWIDGGHLRAARGLLNWTMQDLSQASGLSLSTVRRMEEELTGSRGRSIQCVVAALRQAGVRFSLIDGAAIAVVRASYDCASQHFGCSTNETPMR